MKKPILVLLIVQSNLERVHPAGVNCSCVKRSVLLALRIRQVEKLSLYNSLACRVMCHIVTLLNILFWKVK